jgi:hypothetical protein
MTLSLLKPDIYELSVIEKLSTLIKNVKGVSSSALTDGQIEMTKIIFPFLKVVLLGFWLVICFDVYRYFFRVPPRPPYAQTPPLLY